MSGPSLETVQVAALRAVAASVREYAESIYLDAHSDMRQYERDWYVKEHFEQLAEHLDQTAVDLTRAPNHVVALIPCAKDKTA